MTRVCFDTEFTDLLNPRLISIGFVAEGDECLYVELLDWTRAECSRFVKDVVLPLLNQPRQVSVDEAAEQILRYFEVIGEPVTLMADSPVDFQLLGELLHDAGQSKPRNLAEALVISPTIAGEIVRENLYASGLRRHHALDDAKALLAAWKVPHE